MQLKYEEECDISVMRLFPGKFYSGTNEVFVTNKASEWIFKSTQNFSNQGKKVNLVREWE